MTFLFKITSNSFLKKLFDVFIKNKYSTICKGYATNFLTKKPNPNRDLIKLNIILGYKSNIKCLLYFL